MARSPEQKKHELENNAQLQAKARALKDTARTQEQEARLDEHIARLEAARDKVERDRFDKDTTWAANGGADFMIDRAKQDQEEDDGNAEQEEGDDENQNDGGGDGGPDDQSDQGDEESQQAGNEQPQQDKGQSPARQRAEQLKEGVIDEAKKRGWDLAKKKAKEMAATALRPVLAFLARYGLIALAILAALGLCIVFLVWLFGGFTHKGVEGVGGSHQVLAVPGRDQQLVSDVKALRDAGKIVFAEETAQDLEWITVGGVEQSPLDLRILSALKYLGSKQELIRVRISRSNGPDMTRRKPVANYAGLIVQQAEAQEPEPIDAVSAYATGQAVGIDQVGTFSDEIAAVDECGVDTNTPMDVKYQEVVSEGTLRPLYEQLAVDGGGLYEVAMSLESGGATDKPITGESPYVTAAKRLDLLLGNLARLTAEGEAMGLDPRAVGYFGQAQHKLDVVKQATTSASGDGLKAVWMDRTKVGQPLDDGLRFMFRGMQVKNMVGWYGDTSDGCKLWKAYEVSNAIRTLVVDLMKMPADPMFATGGKTFDSDMVMAQIIVYSPEDGALDDNIPVMDVFPNGAKNVDAGGISFDASGADGKVDLLDNHFAGLPQDHGVFAKPGTIFIYSLDGWERAGNILADFTPIGGFRQLQELLDGAGLGVLNGQKADFVSYKGFIHVAV